MHPSARAIAAEASLLQEALGLLEVGGRESSGSEMER
jgi:hypothetical protein